MDNKMRMDDVSENHSANEQGGAKDPFKKSLSRRTVLRTGTGLLVVAIGTGTFIEIGRNATLAASPPPPKPTPQPKPTPKPKPTPPGSGANNAAVQWNNAALQAIRDISPGPTIASRALAIMHTCMYDAWATYDHAANPTRPNGIPRQKPVNDATEAVSYAAYNALMDLFPADAALYASLMQSLGFDPTNTTTDITTQAGVGNVAAQAVISYRHNDGSNQLNGYADTSGYVPVNTPTQINDPTKWQPLLVNGKQQKYTTPHWGTITPFALTSGSQFRPTTGPATDYSNPSGTYVSQANTILQYSAQLNDTTKTIADYWANGPHSETPPGHWELFVQFANAQYISKLKDHALSDDVMMFFIQSNAVFDAGIACWECKRYYNSVRPITAVRYLYNGQQITAWGGYNQGTQTIDGGQWLPYQESFVVTPPFPEYVSGHSTFSAAGAYCLQQATGSDTFGNSYTAAAGSSLIEPGFAPTQSVTLSWPTLSAAAAEAGISRQYGGIHFNQGDQDGRILGKQVATAVWAKAVGYISGKIQPGS
ncbi:vanadium-dependent haloperoxidase [Dictyobacter kobayashii]|uniref:vanadium-dependent haloperoxidase n=1 Tax=Dictyobacter kobayashii TaxID=2014872 RepID=UPI001FE88957|nr:vanadium-dependent haloperoxidase [Dictyobacter kobayashii]